MRSCGLIISPRLGCRFALGALLLVAACGGKSKENEERKVPPRFWTKTGEESCGRMDRKVYCFPNKYIDAKSFDTDTVTGYLFFVPVKDRDLLECNKMRYDVTGRYPFIKLAVGEVIEGDTLSAKYGRVKEMKIGLSSSDVARPETKFSYLGMDCLKYKTTSLLHEEMMCYGGDLKAKNPAFFFGCMWDGSVPNPACRDTLYKGGLEYRISYNKTCQPYVLKIRQYMLDFVEAGRLLGGMYGVPEGKSSAIKLYRQAASDSGGTTWVYAPSPGGNAPARVLPVHRGSKQLGLDEAKWRLEQRER